MVALIATVALPILQFNRDVIAWSQGGQDKSVSPSKVVRMNRAPVSKDILKVKLPTATEVTLENGLTVLILEDHRFPAVSVQLQMNSAGALYEPSSTPGTASAAASLLREGTTTRTSKQIAEDVDKLGATLNAFAGFGSPTTVIVASGLSDNVDEWFALLVDVLMNPTFPADELAKYKTRQLVQLKQQRTQPSFLANERFSRALYNDHPAATVSATEASINGFSSEALTTWHHERYVPQTAILGIAGDVNSAEFIPKLKKWFAGWKKTVLKETFPPNPSPAGAKKIYLVDRPNSVQTTLSVGNLAIDRLSPDYLSAVVMNRIVGGGPAARLFINLREEKGYTYGVYSNITAPKYVGQWSASGDFRTDVTDGAMKELLYEINRIRDQKVPDSELDDSKRALVANFALSLEQPNQLLAYAVTRKYYNLPKDYWDTYPAKLMAISADDVQRVAKKYLSTDAIQMVAVGDASKIKSVLDKYGPVETYDVDGKVK
jgi:predicted Zn-dependent peptidase